MALISLGACGTSDDSASSAQADAAAELDRSAASHEAERGQLDREAKEQDAMDAQAARNAESDGDTGSSASDVGAASRSASGFFSDADAASFEQLAASLPGAEGVAVAGLGTSGAVDTLGDLRGGTAWSTAKAPVAMAAIKSGTASTADLTAAITASDNAAAERLFSGLGANAADKSTAQLRAAGDASTTIPAQRLRAGYSTFGQADWSLADQARFAGGMRCTAEGERVLGLMRQVVAGQRWGLGGIGSEPAFKGGWGPGATPGQAGGWMERQMGVVTIDGQPLAVAIASTAPNHASGQNALTKLADWVASHADAGASGSPDC